MHRPVHIGIFQRSSLCSVISALFQFLNVRRQFFVTDLSQNAKTNYSKIRAKG